MSGARRGTKRRPAKAGGAAATPTSTSDDSVDARSAAMPEAPAPSYPPRKSVGRSGAARLPGARPRTGSNRPSTPGSARGGDASDVREAKRLSLIAGVAVGVMCVFVLLQLRLNLIFADTTPIGGDFGAHSAGPGMVQRQWWDHGLLSGWSSAWNGGHPLYRFYMVLPAAFAALVGYVLPMSVALKLIVALPLVLLPWAVAYFAKAGGLTFPGQVLAGAASLIMLFDSSNNSFGGNVASTVLGEYAYAWSMLFCVAALAVFARDLRLDRSGPATGGVAGLAAACHPIGAMFVLVGLVTQAALEPAIRRRVAAVHLVRSLLLAGLIASFWYLPFLWYGDERVDAVFTKRTDFASILFPFPLLLEVVFVVLAGLAVHDAWRGRRRSVLALAITAAVFAVAVLAVPQGAINNGRLTPVWNLSRLMLAGIGAGVVVGFLIERVKWKRRSATMIGAPLGIVAMLLVCISWNVGTLPLGDRTTTSLGDWTLATDYQWIIGPRHELPPAAQFQALSFAGLERGPYWAEYEQLIDTLGDITAERGCGRLGHEFDPSGRYGSIYALQLLPMFTDDCITTINGLLAGSRNAQQFQPVAESAWSAVAERYNRRLPFEEPDLGRGVAYLRELGCRYYLASTPEIVAAARETDGLTELATVGPWSLFEVAGATLVEPLARAPYVDDAAAGRDEWSDASMTWFQLADSDAPRPSWGGADGWPASAERSAERSLDETEVSNVVRGDGTISFDVTVPGVPVLVRESYFPTWKVSGADGPYRVAPNWMVVVPRETSVRLTSEAGTVEVLSSLLTLIGLSACVVLAVVARRPKPTSASEIPET